MSVQDQVMEIIANQLSVVKEEGTQLVTQKALQVLEESIPLISAELDQVEKPKFISAVKPKLRQLCSASRWGVM